MKKLIRFFKKPYRWGAVFSAALALLFSFTLLDAFVIPRAQAATPQAAASQTAGESAASETPAGEAAAPAGQSASTAAAPTQGSVAVDTDSYTDDNIQITIKTLREYGTDIYVADIQVADPSLLQTAFAQDTFGRNIKETTSDIADDNDAILAINGDYYGFRDTGYVIRNGTLYRGTSGGAEDLVIGAAGDFSIINEGETAAAALLENGAQQVLSFGPALIQDGVVTVDENSEVSGKSMNSNPRTAIGQIGPLHYIVVVSDGRTGDNAGLSLYQLAQVMAGYGCTTAYNLDGGGSTTLVFNGQVINTPVNGRGSSERKVSDIVYIGY